MTVIAIAFLSHFEAVPPTLPRVWRAEPRRRQEELQRDAEQEEKEEELRLRTEVFRAGAPGSPLGSGLLRNVPPPRYQAAATATTSAEAALLWETGRTRKKGFALLELTT